MTTSSPINGKYRLVPDWTLPVDKKKKVGNSIRIHPHTLIRFIQKKWGIGQACKVAFMLIKSKYDDKFNQLDKQIVAMANPSK